LYVPNDNKIYLEVNYLKYEPHILLENNIKIDGSDNLLDIDNIHKIYSYDGDFKLNIQSEGTETNLLVVSKLGDLNIKNSVTANDIYLQGKIYDKLGNDLIQIINNFDYTNLIYFHDIRACNYHIQASNLEFTPTGSNGFVINSGQDATPPDERYNIFTVYDNDSINKYTRFNITKEGRVSINKDIGDYALDVSGTIKSDYNIITPRLNIIGQNSGIDNIVNINSSINDDINVNQVDITNNNLNTTLNINHNSGFNNILSVKENNISRFNIKKGGKIGFNKEADDVIDMDFKGVIRVSDTIYTCNLVVFGNQTATTTSSSTSDQLTIFADTNDVNIPAILVKQLGTVSIAEFYKIEKDADDVITNKMHMIITNSGKIGLGVESPDYNLHVKDDVKFNSNLYIANNVGIGTIETLNRLEVSGGNALFNNNIGIGTIDNNYRLNVSDGDVNFSSNLIVKKIGINTNNPSSKLTINNTITYCSNQGVIFDHSIAPLTVNSLIRIPENSLNNPIPIVHLTRDGSSDEQPGIRATFSLSRYRNKDENNKDDNNTRLDINLANSNYNNCNVITMLSNGYVGIGITNPLYALHIKGDVFVDGSFRLPAAQIGGENSYIRNTLMYVDSSGNMNTRASISIHNTLDRIGIGITTPSYSLDVSGSIHNTSNLYVDQYIIVGSNITVGSNLNVDNNLYVYGRSEFTSNIKAFGGITTTNNSLIIAGSNLNVDSNLYVYGRSEFTSNIKAYGGITTTNNSLIIAGSNLNINSNLYIGVSHNSILNDTYKLQINNNINEIGLAFESITNNLYVKNDIIASAYSQLSDVNVKTNITNLEYNNNTIMNLRPVSFNWSSNYYNKNRIGEEDVGLIAQEVEKYIPGIVYDNLMLDGNKWKTVNYTGLIPYMIKHIQDLNKRIETLEDTNKRIEMLEYKLNNM